MPKGVYARKKRSGKREEILRAATRVYAHYGFEGATIERMAGEAGVSKSLLGELFGSKQELVKAIVGWAVQKNLEALREIDADAGLTLRAREWLVHDRMRQSREEWCLILGTVLVPSFAFQQRGDLSKLLDATTGTVLARLDQLREPTPLAARHYAHTVQCLHTGYVLDGREQLFREGMARHMELYLLPEKGEPDGSARNGNGQTE